LVNSPGEKGLGNIKEEAEFPFYYALLKLQHLLLSMKISSWVIVCNVQQGRSATFCWGTGDAAQYLEGFQSHSLEKINHDWKETVTQSSAISNSAFVMDLRMFNSNVGW